MRYPTVRECVDVFDSLWPPDLAEDWDTVGLAVGDPDAEVRSILLALDPTDASSPKPSSSVPTSSSPTTRCSYGA